MSNEKGFEIQSLNFDELDVDALEQRLEMAVLAGEPDAWCGSVCSGNCTGVCNVECGSVCGADCSAVY